MVHSKVQIFVYLVLWTFCINLILGNVFVAVYFSPCNHRSSSFLLYLFMTLCGTLWQQSWSTSWTSSKTRIRKLLLPWAPIPSMSPMTTFIRTTSTHLVILMREVCSTRSAKYIETAKFMDSVKNYGFVLIITWWKLRSFLLILVVFIQNFQVCMSLGFCFLVYLWFI